MNQRIRIIHTLFNNKKTRKYLVKFRVPICLAGFIGLLFIAKPDWFWPAFSVALAGEAIQLWCFASLDKKSVLAFNGLYKYVRNPMYLGRFFIAMGYLLLLANLYVIIPFIILYYLYMWNRVQREEKTLRGIFDESYGKYCKKVNRFIPSLRGMPGGRFRFWSWRLFRQNHGPVNLTAMLISFAVIYLFFYYYR